MRYRARKSLRLGPYFRHYAGVVDRRGGRGGFTSHGLKIGWLTVNFTRGTWSLDTPGPGGVSGRLPWKRGH